MESRIIKSVLLTLSFMVNPVLAANPSTSTPSELMLSQVAIEPLFLVNNASQITVYASLLDDSKEPIQSVKPEEITITLDGQDLPKKSVPTVSPFWKTGEGVAYTLLLDVSKTMKGEPFDKAREATEQLIEKMRPTDWVAVITFGDEVRIIKNFVNVSQKNEVISELHKCEATGNNTHLYQAILDAFSLNKRIDSLLPVRRALFVITDGKDEGSGIQPSDLEPAIYRNSLPIYSVGYTRIEKTYLDSIKRLAKLSGGNFVDKSTDPDSFSIVYKETVADILNQLVIRANVSPGLKADGYNHSVKVTVTQGSAKIYGEKTVAFLHESVRKPTYKEAEVPDVPDVPDDKPPEVFPDKPGSTTTFRVPVSTSNPDSTEDHQWWWYVLPGLILTIILSLVWFKLRNKPADTGGPIPEPIPVAPTAPKTMSNTAKTPKLGPHFQVQFLVIEGPPTGKQMLFPIDEKGITIGRQGADLVVNDPQVAKVHCVVQKRNKRLVVKNVEANRETFINGIPVSQKDVLVSDEVILLGETKIRVRILK